MSIFLRVMSGALGLIMLIGTILLAIWLLQMNPEARVILAGYMGIGGIIFGAYLLFYSITGEWRPNLTDRGK